MVWTELASTLLGVGVLTVITVVVLATFGVARSWESPLAIARGAVQLAVISVILTGIISSPAWVAVALPGILIVAALFLRALQRLYAGPAGRLTPGFTDLRPSELVSAGMLLALTVVIGVLPRFLLDVIEPAAQAVVTLVGR